MDPIYIVIIVVLLVLSAIDLTVGVANDAVNFLNSSIGSKVAPLWVILTVASVGVLIGAVSSSGMMEIARKGIFHPEMFTFPQIMTLFLAVMITDVIVLDIFNTFGLPTSTTVTLVFDLLGAAVAVALFAIWQSPEGGSVAEYINSGKALAIISAIFISIFIAFITGSLVMYLSRLLFTFNYHNTMKYFGAAWSGLALTAITYFAVFKGLKKSVLFSGELMNYIHENLLFVLVITFVAWTIVMFICQFLFKINILKIIVLSGTLALALSFAGNDLVNFIGVFMAGLSSFDIASAFAATGGDIMTLKMAQLSEPVNADWRYLLGSGVIMILALWFSKKSRSVTETEVKLARQGEGMERFTSSALSRSVVRGAIGVNDTFHKILPNSFFKAVDTRFAPKILAPQNKEEQASFDLIRASVNLTIAALLISLGTSLKLPLSTTYVTFMVAMGSSLADRAWGRESAVYRITGVLTVIGGWFITAIVAFSLALIVGLVLAYGGTIAMIVLIGLVVFLLIKSNILHKKREEKKKKQEEAAQLSDELSIVKSCTNDVKAAFNDSMNIYKMSLEGLTNEDRKLLKNSLTAADDLYESYRNRRIYEVVPTLQKIQVHALDIEQEYVQLVDYSYEISKSLKSIADDSYLYIENNHKGFTEAQVEDLTEVRTQLMTMVDELLRMIENDDYSAMENVVKMREAMLELCIKHTKRQIKRAKAKESGTRSSVLYLNIISETKLITLQSSNLIRSQRNMNYTLSNSPDKL